ncbi:peptide ABC transporter permease [Microlunatus endophyticus]|uniref:Peptide ABC transporter permease n=1 Tax=Microlunatus endophyticus TaxID=1716077 RepID=A0A917SB90_9ACTN|nr:ABC transporter permease [Microlunatus endophyticus]GGL64662.1 peptide ABC transporter permease [Microlunatus endophyticus]
MSASADAALVGTLPLRTRRRRMSAASVVTALACVWILLVVLASLVPGLLVRGDIGALHASRVLQHPGVTLLGTDQYGRSVAGLLVFGARGAMIIGVAATFLALVLGGLIGLIAGYYGGVTDMIIGRVLDVLLCFPGVLLALIITVALGPTTGNLILGVGISATPSFARVMRGQVMSVRGRLYVHAARSVGFRPSRLLFRHVMPNAITPVVVLATVSIGTAIVASASLSFLGLGPKHDIPDWGQLLAEGQPYLGTAWWMSTFAGLVITCTVIAVSLLGDWIRDRMDRG